MAKNMKPQNGTWRMKATGGDHQGSNAMHANHMPTNMERRANTAATVKTRHGANGSCEAGCC